MEKQPSFDTFPQKVGRFSVFQPLCAYYSVSVTVENRHAWIAYASVSSIFPFFNRL